MENQYPFFWRHNILNADTKNYPKKFPEKGRYIDNKNTHNLNNNKNSILCKTTKCELQPMQCIAMAQEDAESPGNQEVK